MRSGAPCAVGNGWPDGTGAGHRGQRQQHDARDVPAESAGTHRVGATDAEAGLALAREQLPELILMDIQLPGMDGLQATALLKGDDATRDIPVVALTALAMKGDEERIRAAGCDGYIAKPMRYQEFLAAISSALPAPQPPGGG
jgi:two-component system, cell cycle response regulator DivK